VNVEAWDYFALLHLDVMSLPKGRSECQVVQYIKTPFVSAPINDSGFELANAYNNWKVPEGLVAHILVSTPFKDPCPDT